MLTMRHRVHTQGNIDKNIVDHRNPRENPEGAKTMKPSEAVLCPNCGRELIPKEQVRDTTAILSLFGATAKSSEKCEECGKEWGIIAMADHKSWLIYLVEPERLEQAYQAAKTIRMQGGDVETIVKALCNTENPNLTAGVTEGEETS